MAKAEASGLPAASTELVVVAQALHWLDPAAFFAEARRVLLPGGIVAVWCYGLQSLGDDRVDRLLRDFYTGIVGPYWSPERRLVESGYRTIPFPFEEVATPPFEMSVHWPMSALLAYLRTWSATARYVRERGHDPVGPLAEALAAVWGPLQTPRTIRWPLSVRVGRVPSPA